MARKRNKSFYWKVANTLTNHPAKLVEATLALWLPLTLGVVCYQLGGDLREGRGLISAAAMTLVAIGLYMVQLTLDRTIRQINRWALAPAISLLILLLARLISGDQSWRAAPEFSLYVIGFTLFWIAGHGLRSRTLLGFSIGCWTVVTLFQLAIGVFQFNFRPDWMGGGLTRSPDQSYLPTIGSLLTPEAYAAVFLAIIPVLGACALIPRFKGFIRLAAGGLATALALGVIIAGSWTAIGVLVFQLFLLPFLSFEKLRQRIKWSFYYCAFFATVTAFAVAANFTFRDHITHAYAEAQKPADPINWSPAIEVIESHPFLGIGLGAYPVEAQKFAVLDQRKPLAARSTVLETIAEIGLPGGLATFSGLLIFFIGAGLMWWRIPLFAPDHEAIQRESLNRELSRKTLTEQTKAESAADEGKDHHSHRRRRRRRRKHSKKIQRSSSAKIFLTGTLISLFSLGLMSVFEDVHHTGAVIISIALVAGLSLRFMEAGLWKTPRHSRWALLIVFLPLIVCVPGMVDGINTFGANAHASDASRALDPYRENPNLAFEDESGMHEAHTWISLALRLNPNHVDSIALEAEAYKWEEFALHREMSAIGADVVAEAEKGLELEPENARLLLLLAEGLRLSGKNQSELDQAYTQAIDAAPRFIDAHLAYADFLASLRTREKDAAHHLSIVLELDPRNPKALDLEARLQL